MADSMGMQELISTMLRRTGGLYVANGAEFMPTVKKENRLDPGTLAAFQADALAWNYVITPEVMDVISETVDDIEYLRMVLDVMADSRGKAGASEDDVVPMYPDFPKRVAEADEIELITNAVMHYTGDVIGVRIMPSRDGGNRVKLGLDVKRGSPTVISATVTQDDVCKVADDLLMAPTAWSPQDRRDVMGLIEWGYNTFGGGERIEPLVTRINEDGLVQRENKAWLVAHPFYGNAEEITKAAEYDVNLPSDVMRVAVIWSNEASGVTASNGEIKFDDDVTRGGIGAVRGDVDLAHPSKFRLTRAQRRKIVSLLAQALNRMTHDKSNVTVNHDRVADQFARDKRSWMKLSRTLHVHELMGKGQADPIVMRWFLRLWAGDLHTLNSRVETLLEELTEGDEPKDKVKKTVTLETMDDSDNGALEIIPVDGDSNVSGDDDSDLTMHDAYVSLANKLKKREDAQLTALVNGGLKVVKVNGRPKISVDPRVMTVDGEDHSDRVTVNDHRMTTDAPVASLVDDDSTALFDDANDDDPVVSDEDVTMNHDATPVHDGAGEMNVLREIIELLKSNPGAYARRLVELLRKSKQTLGGQEAVIRGFDEIAGKVSTRVLVEIWNLMQVPAGHTDGVPKWRSVVLASGKTVALPVTILDDVPRDQALEIQKVIEDALHGRNAGLNWVIEGGDDVRYAMPLSTRFASGGKTAARGTRVHLNYDLGAGDAPTIRLFMHWHDIENDVKTGDDSEDDHYWGHDLNRVDLDLSVMFATADLSRCESVWYGNLRSDGSMVVHSGDVTSAPDGACEYIDLDVTRMIEAGWRYVIPTVHSFTGQTFDVIPEAFAGVMMRDGDPQVGEVFEATTVSSRFDLDGVTTNEVPFVFDLITGEMIWLDSTVRSSTWRSVGDAKNASALLGVVDSLIHSNPMTVETLAGLTGALAPASDEDGGSSTVGGSGNVTVVQPWRSEVVARLLG